MIITGVTLVIFSCLSDDQLHRMVRENPIQIISRKLTRKLSGAENIKLFVCGSEIGEERRKYFFVWYGVKVLTDAFPEISDPVYNPPKVLRKKLDVVKHRAGPRDIMLILKNQYGCKVNPDDFPGRTVVISDQPIETETKGLRSYHIGSIGNSVDSLLIPPALMLMNVWDRVDLEKILRSEKKPKNSQKYFLMYAQSNCGIKYREEAFDELSDIGYVHQGGPCWGLQHDRSKVSNHITMDRQAGKTSNKNIYKDYRYALVMENKKHPGFISEKIMNSFLSGSIPIWYGSTEIFSIFNRKSFIYYDIDDPKAAVNKIAYLEYNRTAYDEMLNEPILVEGGTTINQWFSFSDKLGDASLKKRIRSMMGYDTTAYHLSLLPSDSVESAQSEISLENESAPKR